MAKAKQRIREVRDILDKTFKGRPKPSAPRAGYKASGSRYDSGGKVSRKKSV